MNLSPLDFIRHAPPGSAVWGTERIDPQSLDDPAEVAWFVREESRIIQVLGKSPEIEFRAGAIWAAEKTVALIPILVRVGRERPDSIFETWLNASDPTGRAALDLLAIQPRLITHLIGDRGTLVRSLVVSNTLTDFARNATAALIGIPPWSSAEFDRQRDRVCAKYPNVFDIWKIIVI